MASIRLFDASSTKLALFFTTMLLIALALLGFEVYAQAQGRDVPQLLSHFILALILIICVGLFFISFYVTKRINTIVGTAERIISTRDLSQRIPIEGAWDDLSKLSAILNAMLAEIEQLVSSVRQVSDNIAHDLRTPLTRLRNHLESVRAESIAASLSPAAQQMQFGTLIHECDALLSTFNALLRIANIESGRRHSEFTTLNLMDVLQDVIELYEPLASEKNVQLLYRAEPSPLQGDKDLLFQAIANLLDNAIKYTPAEGIVVVTVTPLEGGARIVISDTGHGIPDEHKENVFRRFYRVEQSRSTPGSGLGLSLVSAIVHLHKGNIALTDHAPTGLIVTVTL